MRRSAFLLIVSVPTGSAAQTVDTYSYDALGRLNHVQTGQGWTTEYRHDQASNRQQVRSSNNFELSWRALDLFHNTGFAEWGGWAANVIQPAGHMLFGPYMTAVTPGYKVASWRMLIDDNTAPYSGDVVQIDVFDATAGSVLASANLNRYQWAAPHSYQVFQLPFTFPPSSAGHMLEFRIYYYGGAHVRVERVGVR